MSFAKWIGASIGWSFGGPIGAIIGLALGSVVDAVANEGGFLLGEGDTSRRRPRQRTTYQSRPQQQRQRTQSGDFEVSLLILASVVIKADERQDEAELNFVRQQFKSMYGAERANRAFKLFKAVSKQQFSTRAVCFQIREMMDHASRLQLLHFLFGIAKADGVVVESELKQIFTISGYLGISNRDYNSIKAMFYNQKDNAYKILEIEKTATIEEIKAAYRKMAKKYHPDRVIHLGEEHQEGAEEKFRQVQQAYEQLQKERRF